MQLFIFNLDFIEELLNSDKVLDIVFVLEILHFLQVISH